MADQQSTNPVFYSESKRRWKLFLGAIRLLIAVILFTSFYVLFTIIREPHGTLPPLGDPQQAYTRVLHPNGLLSLKSTTNSDFHNLRSQIGHQADFAYAKDHRIHGRHALMQSHGENYPVHAGFYVNWDVQSFLSLRDHIDQLSLVIPEWLFVSDSGDSFTNQIDTNALTIMREHKVPITPMISNYNKEEFDSSLIHKLLSSEDKQNKLIKSLVLGVCADSFAGLNVDFENLHINDNDMYTKFIRKLATALHEQHKTLSIDVSPGDDDYDIAALASIVDNIMIMAYDMHAADTKPGPVADCKWVETILDSITSKAPSSSCILGIPSYGYDWPDTGKGEDITYVEAAVTAKESEGNILFDNNGYNCTYEYWDDNEVHHTVWFADAATDFNLMRIATQYDLAGVAVWRLGAEDGRIWKFFSKSLSDSFLTLSPYFVKNLEQSAPLPSVDFEGQGEILDILSAPDSGIISIEIDSTEKMISEEIYTRIPSTYVIKKMGVMSKVAVLTFDDGPSREYTPAILDILKKEHVPAAFFIVGINAEQNLPLLARIYKEGHEIGNHTFTHPNLAQISRERVQLELNTTKRIIESVTGHATVLFRPPYNADAEPRTMDEIIPVMEAKENGYITIGESVDPNDWEPHVTADSIVNRVIKQNKLGSILLFHDAGGNRSQTVKALPAVIKYYRDKGYRFVSLSEFMQMNKQELMPPLPLRRDRYIQKFNWSIAEVLYWAGRGIIALFIISIVLAVGRTIAISLLAYFQLRRQKRTVKTALLNAPLVSIIVPAYNEEVTAIKTVETLLKSTYPNFEIIFVDDGSKDETYKRVMAAFAEVPKVRVFTKANGGKSSALNFGIDKSQAQFIVCIDADTQLRNDAVQELINEFSDPNVGAVAGNVKVGNEKRSLLTRWQAIEYITSQNFDRRAFDLLNCITVIPGAIGAFRTEALKSAGNFTYDTLAEDADLTIRLLRNGWRVSYANNAIAFTEAPEKLDMFMRQRYRWSFGTLQCVWKHRDTAFNSEYKSLGWVAIPNLVVFQFIMPLFAPLADIVMLWSILQGFWQSTIAYYIGFSLVDILAAACAFTFEKEKIGRLIFLLPQRILYRQLLTITLYRSLFAAIRGTFVRWGAQKRTGTVETAET